MSWTLGLLAVVALLVLYWYPVRRWYLRWGATDAEVAGPLPGDDVVAAPTYGATAAVTADAPIACVWPWLVQMGRGRGGLYSYDWLDRLFGVLDEPSAERILPEHQHLAVGDAIPVGGSAGGFPVKAIEPGRALVLGGEPDGVAWSWAFLVTPLDASRTRLVSRSRGRVSPGLRMTLLMIMLEPQAFIMTRRMLLGIKRRAEGLARAGDRSAMKN